MALSVRTPSGAVRALGPTAVARRLARRLGMPRAMFERHRETLVWLARHGSPAQLRRVLA